jgi:hypothetical protein
MCVRTEEEDDKRKGWARWAAWSGLAPLLLSPFFSEFFSSSFCYRISGKRKNGERDRLRKISKQVSDICEINILSQTIFKCFANILVC